MMAPRLFASSARASQISLFHNQPVATMRVLPALSILCVCLNLAPAYSQNAEEGVSLELNRIDTIDGSCRLTFLLQSSITQDLETLSLESVLLDKSGRVVLLTLFDFGAVPHTATRVRQFDIPGLPCEGIGRVLINGVSQCGSVSDCESKLTYSTRTDLEVTG